MRKSIHHIHAVVFLVLLVSGFLLHFSILRGPLAAYRLFLIKTHAYAGEIFGALVIAYIIFLFCQRSAWWGRKHYRWFVIFTFGILAVWVTTGWVLLQKSAWGAVVTTFTFELHRWLAYLAVPMLLWHLWMTAAKPMPDTVSKTRRKFFGWFAAGVGGVWGYSLIARYLARNKPQDIRSNANCDVFIPVPEPAKDSLPPIGGGARGTFGEYSAMNFLPCLHHETWRFNLDGLVERSVTFRWEDFVRLPRKVQVSDFHCVEGWSVLGITYEGLMVSDLLKIAGIRPEARFVKFYSSDGDYADTLTIDQAHMPDVMIAMLMDGKPISRVLGGPARLIVPKMYAYKAVKWVNRMELIDKPYMGYWEFHGFETDAWLGLY